MRNASRRKIRSDGISITTRSNQQGQPFCRIIATALPATNTATTRISDVFLTVAGRHCRAHDPAPAAARAVHRIRPVLAPAHAAQDQGAGAGPRAQHGRRRPASKVSSIDPLAMCAKRRTNNRPFSAMYPAGTFTVSPVCPLSQPSEVSQAGRARSKVTNKSKIASYCADLSEREHPWFFTTAGGATISAADMYLIEGPIRTHRCAGSDAGAESVDRG